MTVSVASPPPLRVEEPGPSRVWDRYSALVVTLVTTLLALIVTQPLLSKFSTAIYADNPGDAEGTIYDFWWWTYALRHGLGLLPNPPLGAPFDAGWQQVPYAVLQVGLFVPLTLLLGAVSAYNLGILASFPATAWLTFRLARRLGVPSLGSAFSALAFTFSPYHVEKAMGHLGQAHLELFPGVLLFLVRWRQAGSRWNLVGAGAVAGLSVWTDFYYALILAFLVLGFFGVNLLLPTPEGPSLARRILTNGRSVIVVAAVGALFIPFAVLLADRSVLSGYGQSLATSARALEHPVYELQVWSLRPRELVQPWHSNPLIPARIRDYEQEHLHGSNPTENSLLLGYTVLLLALIAIVATRRAFPVGLSLVMSLEGIVLALPPHFTVGPLKLIGPGLVLHRVTPFFRVYSRFAVLALLGTALLAGLGFAVLQVRFSKFPWLLLVPFALLGLEFNNQPPSHVLTLFPAPEAYRWLATQPAGILVEYPLAAGRPEIIEVQTEKYLLYQTVHAHPLFNNLVPTSPARLLAPSLEPYDKPGVAQEMAALGIRYVFVHRHALGNVSYAERRSVPGLQFVGAFDDTDVFVVTG